MMGIAANPMHHSSFFPDYIEAINECTKVLLKDFKTSIINYTPKLSLLYNAYTEKDRISDYNTLKNLSCDSIYSDSGGLQIITAGKEKTDDIKRKIYQDQSKSDYAFCFDEIPLKTISSPSERTRNERMNIQNKYFDPSDHKEAGRLTGINIKTQIEYFQKVSSNTKVIVIIQGNKLEDMILYHDEILNQLEEDHFKHIAGIAVADTCMGNGELETVEMLYAAKKIADNTHPSMKSHLHLLGVGSKPRIRPAIYLKKSGFLDTFNRISYDSSSHTSTFNYGLMKLNGTCVPIGSTRKVNESVKNPTSLKHFNNMYSLFEEVLRKFVTREEFLQLIFGNKSEDMDYDWKFSTIKKRAIENNIKEEFVVSFMIPLIYILYQIHNFKINVDMIWNETYNGDSIRFLDKIKTEEDMKNWIKDYSSYVASNRIKRGFKTNTLEEFFDE